MVPDYLLIGHVTVDLQPEGRILGGTVSYIGPMAPAFGLRSAVLTSAAPDEPLLRPLIDSTELMVLMSAESSTFENVYAPGGRRTQMLHRRAGDLRLGHIPSGWMQSPLVHLAPLTDEVDPDIVHHFPDATVLLTPQGWMRRWDDAGRVSFKPWFDEAVLSAVDIVVFSQADIAEAPELEAQYAAVTRYLVVTNGENGGHFYVDGVRHEYQTPQVNEIEPTGAGDVFAGSLLMAYHRLDGDIGRAVQVAAHLAAVSVTRVGIDGIPRQSEVDAALERALR